MSQEQWSAVDSYITEMLAPADAALDAAMAANHAAELPGIDVTPSQGKLLHLLAKMQGARRILEIGTLGGYSTIWLARALPADGRLVTLEVSPKHAEVARANLARAGVGEKVEIRVGAALETLAELQREGAPPFDLIFVDADKENLAAYVRLALQLSRPGSLIICDNVVREGRVIDANNPEPQVQGARRLFEMLAAEPRLSATAVQTVGAKGWDGFTFAMVLE